VHLVGFIVRILELYICITPERFMKNICAVVSIAQKRKEKHFLLDSFAYAGQQRDRHCLALVPERLTGVMMQNCELRPPLNIFVYVSDTYLRSGARSS
jgi:hypothetical protein